MTAGEAERIRWAVYAAIAAALRSGHPRREAVARALERLVLPGGELSFDFLSRGGGHPHAAE